MAEIKKPIEYSPSWTFFEGKWHDGNVPIMGPRTHAAWLGSVVFDGARAFEGVAPDLDRHIARANQSAINFGLKPVVDAGTWLALAKGRIYDETLPLLARAGIRPTDEDPRKLILATGRADLRLADEQLHHLRPGDELRVYQLEGAEAPGAGVARAPGRSDGGTAIRVKRANKHTSPPDGAVRPPPRASSALGSCR